MTLHRTLVWVAGTFVLLLSALPVRAIDVPPRPPTSAPGKIRDLAATVRVRRALQEDSVLAGLNLSVWVENGVASLWGPVPTEEIGRQAVTKLESVRDIAEVRPNLYVRKPEPERLLLAERAPPADSLARIDVFKPDSDQIEPTPPARPAAPVPLNAELAAAPPRQSPPRAMAKELATPRLLAPRAVASARRPPEAEVVRRPRANLAEQVEQARRADPRFRDIPVRLNGTSVEVRRAADDDGLALALANALRRIPGLTDVVLTDD